MLEPRPMMKDHKMSQALTWAYSSLAADLAQLVLDEDPVLTNRMAREVVLSYEQQFVDCRAKDLWHVVWKHLNGHMLAEVTRKMYGG